MLLQDALSTRHQSRWPEPPRGDRRPAMLVPGFLAGDPSLSRMAQWLSSGDWVTTRSGIRWNVDCMEPALAGLERRLEESVRQAGDRRALLVGQSRGGTLGRVLAVRRPDLVETLVTLGSPVLDQLAVSRTTSALVTLVGVLGTIGVPGVFSHSCRNGACCEIARRQLAQPLAEDMRYLSFYTRKDAIVSWKACLDPGAELVEAGSTHMGMGMSRGVWAELSARLGR